ncbi:hypothetical protein [Stenotrophomonas maltophilia]|uniref:hypothetical protein n=1 Tax=Stenotrophomonas maltophilia TaxID=40324 RepID=UPI003BF81A90
MKMTIDEILNESIMSSTRMIIVEGANDPKIYLSIADECDVEADVHCIGNIDGYGGGCNGIIDAIGSLCRFESPSRSIKNHILGIIDKDTRDFRQEIPAIPAILTLKYYSIESHFTGPDSFRYCINTYTRAHHTQIPERFLDACYSKINEDLMDIYYPSLDALRHSLEPGYEADCQYSFTSGRLDGADLRAAISQKTANLDQFAASKRITKNRETLNLIAHGRWLLSKFANRVHQIISTMHDSCGSPDLPSCRFCVTGDKGGCSHKIKEGITFKTIYSTVTENTKIESIDYIRNRISSMKELPN